MSFLKPEHQEHITRTYQAFATEPGFAHVATLEEIAAQEYSLSIPLYVRRNGLRENQADYETRSLRQLWDAWEQDGRAFWQDMDGLVEMLDDLAN